VYLRIIVGIILLVFAGFEDENDPFLLVLLASCCSWTEQRSTYGVSASDSDWKSDERIGADDGSSNADDGSSNADGPTNTDQSSH